MSFLLINHIQNASEAMRRNKTRTVLTVTGITIGVAAISFILAMTEGAMNLIHNQVTVKNDNLAIIYPGKFDSNLNLQGLSNIKTYTTSNLTFKDIEGLKKLKDIELISPISILSASVHGIDKNSKVTQVIATNFNFFNLSDLKIANGETISNLVNQQTAVIGKQLAIDIFGTESPIGQTMKIHGIPVTVIGILEREEKPINYNNIDYDKAVFTTLDCGRSINDGILQIQQINFKAKDPNKLNEAIEQAKKIVKKNHSNDEDFTILSGNDISRPSKDLFSSIAIALTSIAAVSIVVGGIGVMNILLVAVSERTREIGIRKAVGATNGNIFMQFMIESILISSAGGVMGYLLGYALSYMSTIFLPFTPSISVNIAIIILGITIGVGFLFGIFPAIKAARKDPIRSLKQTN